MNPIAALFNFTIKQTLVSRKIWLTLLVLTGPCALVILIRCFADPPPQGQALWEMYHVLVQFLLIMGLVPLICLVHGTALISADVESRTIVYLTTRRMRRATVFLVKFVATALVLAVLCDLGMMALHFCVLTGQELPSSAAGASADAVWNPRHDFTCYLWTIPTAVWGFLAIFSLIGFLTARPLTLAVFYLIAFEIIISNLPIGVRVYSLLHYVRMTMTGLMPRVAALYELPRELGERLYPEGTTGLPQLSAIVLIALVLSGILITVRELTPAKVSRE